MKTAPPAHRLIIQPDDGIDPIAGAITRAQKTLTLKQYTFVEPGLLRATIDAHKNGVDVRVLLNRSRIEGLHDNEASFKELEDAGVKVKWSSSRFLVTHEKSIVVDGNRAFILSFNLAEKFFSQTRDHGIRTEDPAQVAQIAECFEADWEDKPWEPKGDCGLLWSPGFSREPMCKFIDEAKHELLVHHPKFVDMCILDRLSAAITRGVHVRIQSGGMHGLHREDTYETAASLRVLQRQGAKVHSLKHPKVHCKMLVADGTRMVVGSINLRPDAFETRRELDIIVTQHDLVQRAIKVFEDDWSQTKHYEPPDPVEVRKANYEIVLDPKDVID